MRRVIYSRYLRLVVFSRYRPRAPPPRSPTPSSFFSSRAFGNAGNVLRTKKGSQQDGNLSPANSGLSPSKADFSERLRRRRRASARGKRLVVFALMAATCGRNGRERNRALSVARKDAGRSKDATEGKKKKKGEKEKKRYPWEDAREKRKPRCGQKERREGTTRNKRVVVRAGIPRTSGAVIIVTGGG